jgi:hypothetical protein
MAGLAFPSGAVLRRAGDTTRLTVTLTKNGQPITGKTVEVEFIRRSDGQYWDFVGGAWQVAPVVGTLVENAALAGVYELDFPQGIAEPNTENDYLGVFQAPPAAPPADRFYGTVEYSFRKMAAPGDAMALTAAAVQAVRAEIMTYVVNGNTLGLTFEQSNDLVRKLLNNRLELTDGTTNNWVLYDDDDVSVLLRYNVTDKSGNAIFVQVAAPARRTRGV